MKSSVSKSTRRRMDHILAQGFSQGSIGINLQVGQSCVFMREGHDWHSCEVSILDIKGKRFTVARCSEVAAGLLAPRGSKKRKTKTWICSSGELW